MNDGCEQNNLKKCLGKIQFTPYKFCELSFSPLSLNFVILVCEL